MLVAARFNVLYVRMITVAQVVQAAGNVILLRYEGEDAQIRRKSMCLGR